jgi:hypothetical protein
VRDIRDLISRFDLDAGQRAVLKTKTDAEWHQHALSIPDLVKDGPAICVACGEDFVFGSILERKGADVQMGDKGFVISLAVIPPQGASRQVRH